MEIINGVPNRFKLYAAGVALSALVIALLAVTFAAGSAQAEGNTPTPTPTPIPQPCGPYAAEAFQPEPHEKTSGHYALFDAYWEDRERNHTEERLLHTNTCPPLVTQRTEADREGTQTTVTTLEPSGVDIDELIIHVLDKYQATVVSGTADDSNGAQISIDGYDKLDEYTTAGEQVWWLRTDYPDTDADDAEDALDLTLGFSTKRFSDQYWGGADDGGKAFRYRFQFERNPGIDPDDHPHFLAYRIDPVKGPVLVWNSAEAGRGEMDMAPGQLEDVEWIFTTPGTYEISAHLLGFVRQEDNKLADAGGDWQPISENITETSEVKRYVIQVGDELDEVEPPQFGVSFTVDESATAGTDVGTPIQVFEAEVDDLSYSLSGKGAEDFALVSTSDPDTVQIKVGDSVTLDHNRQATYHLTLGVTDELDHESNPNLSLDDTLVVRIDVLYPRVTIEVDNPNPVVGETVTFTAQLHNMGPIGKVTYTFTFSDITYAGFQTESRSRRHNTPTTETVRLQAFYLPEGVDDDRQAIELTAEPVTVTWSNP